MDNFVDNFLDGTASDIGQIEMRPVGELRPLEKNPRRHGEDSIAAIMTSIREFGFRNPLLVDGNRIIAGNGRHEAAKRLGMSEVPTLAIRGLTPEQIRAYIMADNATAERSSWDVDVLRFELDELRGLEFDISTIGFSEREIEQFLATDDMDLSAQWAGMPEYNQQDHMPYRSMIVHFENDADVDAFAKLVGQSISKQTKYIWYPKIQRHSQPHISSDDS